MDVFVEELIDPDGLPKETIRRCLEHPDRATPSFLSLLQQYADNPNLNDDRADALGRRAGDRNALDDRRRGV